MTLDKDMFRSKDAAHGPLPSGPVRARLKWFNEPKGFGFVVLEDGNIDAFLHITTLQRAGIELLDEGTCLLCHIERGPKGAQVRQIAALLDGEAAPPAPATDQDKDAPPLRLEGAVKWYKPEKGFGFITPDDGQKDVFLHKSCLEDKGLTDLPPGMRLSMTVRIVPKGREVIDFQIISPGTDDTLPES